jgi:hypothetical protein
MAYMCRGEGIEAEVFDGVHVGSTVWNLLNDPLHIPASESMDPEH